ncbi:MAG: hypothetical protein KAQ68_11055, partial [Clostridiales bacterium]|nr:hypothetical protein [Clostridiales bacterium]
MKKRATIIILVFIILFSLLPIASASDVSQTKRHVAMVYDDSTSMYISDTTNKPVLNWAYANYMTQAFYGLLNPIDSLYITYMSDVEKETSPTNLMLMDRASALDSIRNKNDYINKTPFEAVETAYNLLYDLEEDLTDEYWLVILTDGAFTGFKKDTTEVLNEYIDQMALASKTLKVVFFAIGNDTKPPIADETKGLFVYSTSSNGIISTMSQVADNISGRHAVSDSNMKLISDNTLEVDMYLPVRSLTILYQQEENTLNSISNETSDSMELLNSYSIKAPEVFEISDEYTIITDENANGMITSIKPDKDEMILSSGKYILEFENEINIENVRVMYEPAIDITLVYKKGTTVVDVLKKGDIISVEVLLVNAKDGTPLDKNALPVPVTCNIQLSSDGELVKSADDFILKDIIITSGNTSIASQITMPGYFTLRDRVDFDVAHPIESTPSPTPGITSTPGVYDDTQGPWPPEVKLVLMPPFAQNIPLDKLEETDPFLFVPSFNGERGQLKDLQLGQLQVICSSEIVFEIIINDTEMGFDIYPKYANGMLTTATGTINASIIFKSEYNKVATTSLSFIV